MLILQVEKVLTMKNSLSLVTNFIRDEDAATAVEYAIMVALIATAIFATVTLVGMKVESLFNQFCTRFANATNGTCS